MVLGIDIGGTKLALAIVANGGRPDRPEVLWKEPISPLGAPDRVLARIKEVVAQEQARSGERLESIGISIGGPLDHEAGIVINFPHLPGWRDLALVEMIEQRFGAPARMDNDANLGALAELHYGAGRDMHDLAYFTLSTGIGGGVIVNDRLVHGVRSSAAEFGHITVAENGPRCACGNRGCLEVMASGTAIAREARRRIRAELVRGRFLISLSGSTEAITAADLARAVAQGDPLSMEIWEEAVEYLAIGVADVIHVLAPPMVVLGGGVAQAGAILIDPLKRLLRNHLFYVPLDRIEICRAELGHDSAVVGAAALAIGAL